MLTEFWKEIGKQLASKWVLTVLTPAFIFWGSGLLAVIYSHGTADLIQWWTALTDFEKTVWLLVLLLTVAVSAALVSRLERLFLRLLEGYWPNWSWLDGLHSWLIARQQASMQQKEDQYQALANKGLVGLSPREKARYVTLEVQLRQMPLVKQDVMPTKLGNRLRAAETLPHHTYGLDSVICWPRLWLLLPETARTELASTRAALNTDVRLLIWGVLFLIWTIYAWWAPLVALIVVASAYSSALNAAGAYGGLIETVFDLYRVNLYQALRWPLPKRPQEEKPMGLLLTEYLWRGSDLPAPVYTEPRKSAE